MFSYCFASPFPISATSYTSCITDRLYLIQENTKYSVALNCWFSPPAPPQFPFVIHLIALKKRRLRVRTRNAMTGWSRVRPYNKRQQMEPLRVSLKGAYSLMNRKTLPMMARQNLQCQKRRPLFTMRHLPQLLLVIQFQLNDLRRPRCMQAVCYLYSYLLLLVPFLYTRVGHKFVYTAICFPFESCIQCFVHRCTVVGNKSTYY